MYFRLTLCWNGPVWIILTRWRSVRLASSWWGSALIRWAGWGRVSSSALWRVSLWLTEPGAGCWSPPPPKKKPQQTHHRELNPPSCVTAALLFLFRLVFLWETQRCSLPLSVPPHHLVQDQIKTILCTLTHVSKRLDSTALQDKTLLLLCLSAHFIWSHSVRMPWLTLHKSAVLKFMHT